MRYIKLTLIFGALMIFAFGSAAYSQETQARVVDEAVAPFQTGALHPAGRAGRLAGQKVERAADADADGHAAQAEDLDRERGRGVVDALTAIVE